MVLFIWVLREKFFLTQLKANKEIFHLSSQLLSFFNSNFKVQIFLHVCLHHSQTLPTTHLTFFSFLLHYYYHRRVSTA